MRRQLPLSSIKKLGLESGRISHGNITFVFYRRLRWSLSVEKSITKWYEEGLVSLI